MTPVLLWLRADLRLDDQPALLAAAERGPVIPVFVWSPGEEGDAAPGAAARWYLHHSLAALSSDLRGSGSQLILRRGPIVTALLHLLVETGARTVCWSDRVEPSWRAIDEAVEEALLARGTEPVRCAGALLHAPGSIVARSGGPLQVYSPFARACASAGPIDRPSGRPGSLPAPAAWPVSEPLEALELLPRVDWAAGLRAAWQPGEAGAQAALRRFARLGLERYHTDRDRPDRDGVSRLSPHLHFGELSIRRVWHAAAGDGEGPTKFRAELLWREFAHHLLWHFPRTVGEPLREQFSAFPWRHDPGGLLRWRRGETGYPIVDAAMRCLWHTGWMHNRLRMIAASFLVKDLLIDWREGADWFWDTLVDADLANNTLGWQWTAGCGADAAPFFRIFNPVLQGRKFDPTGTFVKQWLPELADLPAVAIHEPWTAGGAHGYPQPILDHQAARARALAAHLPGVRY